LLNKYSQVLKVVDKNPSHGVLPQFLKNHFDVRGVPPFNSLISKENVVVFPVS